MSDETALASESTPKYRYFIEIDEEGYPQFEGLRVQDEALLKTILEGLRRSDPANSSSLIVSECAGEVCAIDAFDAPLVAQSVEEISGEGAKWVFPADAKSCFVKFDQVEVDEWNRLHATVGEDKIPAVLSRKAQASLLNQWPDANLSPKRFRDPHSTQVSEVKFWASCYLENRDGWELWRANPVLEKEGRALVDALPRPKSILVPGAGRGHDAVWLERAGAAVTTVDFTEESLSEFTKTYPSARAQKVNDDIFDYLGGHPRAFDAVFEHTLFCAFHPLRRQNYFDLVTAALKPRGYFFGVFFIRTGPSGPPFGLTQWELREFCRRDFDIRAWKLSRDSTPARWGQELWVILQKK